MERFDIRPPLRVSRDTMTSHLRSAAGALALVLATPGAMVHRAPKIVEITGVPKCANCGVRLQEIANLASYVGGSSKLEINAYAYDRKRKLAYVRRASRPESHPHRLDGKVQVPVGS